MGIYCLNDNYIQKILFSTSNQFPIFAPINQQKHPTISNKQNRT